MAFFQARQVRHIASGQIFNATPALEMSPDYEPYSQSHTVIDSVPVTDEAEVAPKRRGRPPKSAALDVDEGASADDDA